MAFAITEPDAGSNSHKITTTARRDGSDWILKGQKVYISGIDQAQAVLVVGRTEEAKTGKLRPALFVVPTDAPGFTYTPIEMELISPERQFQVFIDDVRLPSDALVGAEDAAIAQLFAGLNPERIMGAASAVGMGRFALDKAVDYVKTRQVWGTPIGAHQGLAHPLAQCHIEVELAKLMMQKAATLYDAGDDGGAAQAANMAKYAAGRGVYARRRPGRAVDGRQRADQGVRRGGHADLVAAGADRADQPRDGAELRRADVAGPAPLLLMDTLVEYAAGRRRPVARLTLNSPHNRNALSTTLVTQLHQGLRAAEADPAVRVVVLGHTGGTFCAGADLSEAGGGDARGDRERGAAGRSGSPPSAYDLAVARAGEMTALLRAIVSSPRPVIAAINGHVRAGGFGLVGACDIVVAGPRSTFALTEARIGVAPAIISLTLLPKLSRAGCRPLLPHRRDVRRQRGRRDRIDHPGRRRRGRRGGRAGRRRRARFTAGPGGVEGADHRRRARRLRPRRRTAHRGIGPAVRLRRGARRHARVLAETAAKLGLRLRSSVLKGPLGRGEGCSLANPLAAKL